jgi:hypothetical protein
MAEIKTEVVTPVKESIFKLIYKKGNILHDLCFRANDQNSAHALATTYCNKKALRLINVSEWLKDLQEMIDFEVDENWKGKSK